jgi:hypothetical protein
MDKKVENWKKKIEEENRFIQNLVNDYPMIKWEKGSIDISGIPKGWEKIVRDLFDCFNSYYNQTNSPPTIIIEQIKSKFAGLRVYFSGGDDVVRGMILMAEKLAFKTCEETGKQGVFCVKNGWYRILTRSRAKKYGYTVIKN